MKKKFPTFLKKKYFFRALHAHTKKNQQSNQKNLCLKKNMLAHFVPGLSMSLKFTPADREKEQGFEDNLPAKQRSVDAYIEYVENGNADTKTQVAAQAIVEPEEKKFDKGGDLDNFERMVPIDDGVQRLRMHIKKEFDALGLRKFPDLAWWFFDKTVQLWGMHLGLSAGGPGFAVPQQFARRSTLATFNELVYRYMVLSPSRQAVLARNDPDEVHFLKLTMRSLVADAILETALVGLRAPFVGNFTFDEAKCEIHCKTIERSVSANLKQFVCYHSGWSQTQHLKQAPKWCPTCIAASTARTGVVTSGNALGGNPGSGGGSPSAPVGPGAQSAQLTWLKNCDECYKLNNGGSDAGYAEDLIALKLVRLLKVASYKTDPFVQNVVSGFLAAQEMRREMKKILKVWAQIDMIEKLNMPGAAKDTDKQLQALGQKYEDLFDPIKTNASKNIVNVYLTLKNVFPP